MENVKCQKECKSAVLWPTEKSQKRGAALTQKSLDANHQFRLNSSATMIIFLDPSDASTSYPFMHEHLFECQCLYMTATAQLQGKVTSVSTVV